MKLERHTKDVGVELARILGCLIVIGCHIYLPISKDGRMDVSRAFVAAFCADGVAVFWLILGFFLFRRKQEYQTLLKQTFSRIVVPLFLFSLFSFFTVPWAASESAPLSKIVFHSRSDYIDLLSSILTWRPIESANHLWYLYIYILVIAVYPALFGLKHQLENSKKIRVFFLVGACYVFVANVFTGNQMMQFSHYTIGGLVPASMIVIAGHFLYQYRACMSKYGYFGPVLFLVLNSIRVLLYIKGFQTILYWYTVTGVLCALSVLAFAIFLGDRISRDRSKAIVRDIGSYTFSVYLVHFFPIYFLRRIHFDELILEKLDFLNSNAVDFLYMLVYAGAVFLISLTIAALFRFLLRIFRKTIEPAC